VSGEDSQRIRDTFGQVELEVGDDPRSTKPKLILVNEVESVRTIPGATVSVPVEEETTAIASASPATLERMRHPPSSKELTARVVTDAEEAADPRLEAMRELYASGDADGALFIATAVQATSERPPPSDPDVSIGAEFSMELDFTLDEAHERIAGRASGVGVSSALEGIPRLLKTATEIAKLPLEPRTGFLIMHVDGTTSVREILDICGMSKEEATTIFRQLLALGVISLRRR
jgi:hypothetical protein